MRKAGILGAHVPVPARGDSPILNNENRPPRSAAGAGFLSFLWPGLGQAWQGRRRSAILWALPPLAAVAIVAGAALNGIEVLALELLTPSVAVTALGLVILLGLWRALSIVDTTARSRRPLGAASVVVVAVLLAAVIGVHGVAAYYAWSVYDAGSQIFVGGDADHPGSSPGTGAVGDPSASPEDNSNDFVAQPDATPAANDSRINILVTGVDSGNGRNHALTDTLMVVSIDPKTKGVRMVSFPRDLANFPLWDGRTYGGKINSLMTYARLHPNEFKDGGLPTLIKELGYLLGVPIHYYAAINLEGFVKMVDLVGGVTIDNQQAINDPRYSWFDGTSGFYLSTGKHKLDGRHALAYARSRQGIGDSDFTRARRQQEILLALRAKLTKPDVITKVPELMKAASGMIRTNFPQDRLGDMVKIAKDVATDNVKQVVLGPPYSFHPPTSQTGGSYQLRLLMDKVKALSVKFFGQDSRYYTP